MKLLTLVTAFCSALSIGGFCTDAVVKAVCTILSRERWATYTVITTTEFSYFPCDSASSTATATTFTIHDGANGTQSLDLNNIYNILPKKYLNVLVMCSANCITELLRQASLMERNKWVESRWLVIPTSGTAGDIANTQVTVKTSQMVILEATHCHDIAREDARLYSAKGSNYVRELPKVWASKCNGGFTTTDPFYPSQKYGFHNKSLIVAVKKSPPFVFRLEVNGSVIFSGVSIDLLNELARRLNFSYTIVEPEDGEWGAEVNGTWTGLIGMLVEKKADLVVAPIAPIKSREDVVDFTVPYFYLNLGMIVRTPPATSLLTLISPFQYNVLIYIAISLTLTTAILLFIEIVSSNHSPYRPADNLRHYGDTVFQIFAALVSKGINSIPLMPSARILLSAWLLFTMILAATYSGNLIASMTDGRQKLPFSSLAELAKQDTYRWGLIGRSFLETLFKESNRSEFQAIWRGIESTDYDVDAHLRRLLKGGYAYIGEDTMFQTWRSHSCDIQFVKEQFFLQQAAVGLPNNSANTEIFSNEILQIYERGLTRYWYDRWTSSSQCKEQKRRPYRVNLLVLRSIFYVLGAGIVLAGVVLVVELLFSTRCYKGRGAGPRVTR